MDVLPTPVPGFVRISVRLPRGEQYTPGELARLSGAPLEDLGPVQVGEGEATVDVLMERGRAVRDQLERLGPTKLVAWQWQWLRLSVGRNHGLSIGQLKKVMLMADAAPLGRINIQNTHTLVGVQDFKLPTVMERLSTMRVNGYTARPEALPIGKGPGSPEFRPGAH